MKAFLSAFSVYPHTKIECNPEYSLGHYDTVLDPIHIYTGGPREPFYTCRLLVLASEENEQETIPNEFPYTNGCGNPRLNYNFSMTRLIDWNYDASRISDRVRQRILSAIDRIRFRPEILDRVAQYTSAFDKGKTLGISVRTWTAPHESNIDRPYDADTYLRAIQEHLPHVTTVVLSVDNPSVLPQYLAALSSKSVVVLTPTDLENETQRAFVKMLALSQCDFFVGARISTFSELVFWFSRCNIRVTPLF